MLVGAVQESVARPSPATAVTSVGAAGAAFGTTDVTEAPARDPSADTEVTLIRYERPFVSPGRVAEVVAPTLPVFAMVIGEPADSGVQLTSYESAPAGLYQVTVAEASPGVAVKDSGAPATKAGVTGDDAADAEP